jgi:hypothetical protein
MLDLVLELLTPPMGSVEHRGTVGSVERRGTVGSVERRGTVGSVEHRHRPSEVWITELGSSHSSGSEHANRFASSLWFADALGAAAQVGIHVACRQALGNIT